MSLVVRVQLLVNKELEMKSANSQTCQLHHNAQLRLVTAKVDDLRLGLLPRRLLTVFLKDHSKKKHRLIRCLKAFSVAFYVR